MCGARFVVGDVPLRWRVLRGFLLVCSMVYTTTQVALPVGDFIGLMACVRPFSLGVADEVLGPVDACQSLLLTRDSRPAIRDMRCRESDDGSTVIPGRTRRVRAAAFIVGCPLDFVEGKGR